MKVAVSVHGRFHAFEVAAELHRRGMLTQLATTWPSWAARRRLPAGVPLATAPMLELVRRLHGRFGGPSPDYFIASRFGRFAAATLPEDADIMLGWSAASLEAAQKAKQQGTAVVIERGSTHILHQQAVLADAHNRLGLPWPGIDPRIIERECAEYALADLIVTGCSAARATFAPFGVDPAKVVVNRYGVDLNRFAAPAMARDPGGKRILFVGQVGVRKGMPWLLEAFARLPADAQLHVVGPLEPPLDRLLPRLPTDRVVFRGPLRGDALAQEFAEADIFCLPSIEEGFGMVILQAMAAGLAVVASDATGAGDIPQGLPVIVPAGQTEPLADALAALLDSPSRRAEMGVAGRHAMAIGANWSQYADRAVSYYREVLARTGGKRT